MRALLFILIAAVLSPGCGSVKVTAVDGGGSGSIDGSSDRPDADPDRPDASPNQPDAGGPDATTLVCGDLRAWYRFEQTSGQVSDSSGCNNHGTAVSVTRGVAGADGNAFAFNGSPAYVEVADSANLSGYSALTVEAWVYHTGGEREMIVSHGDGNGGDPYALSVYTQERLTLTIGDSPTCSGGGFLPEGSAAVPLNTWTHLAASFDTPAGMVRFYMNGSLLGSHPVTASDTVCDNSDSLVIGAYNVQGAWNWQGMIDELKIWATVRTQAQICEDAGGTPQGQNCVFN